MNHPVSRHQSWILDIRQINTIVRCRRLMSGSANYDPGQQPTFCMSVGR